MSMNKSSTFEIERRSLYDYFFCKEQQCERNLPRSITKQRSSLYTKGIPSCQEGLLAFEGLLIFVTDSSNLLKKSVITSYDGKRPMFMSASLTFRALISAN